MTYDRYCILVIFVVSTRYTGHSSSEGRCNVYLLFMPLPTSTTPQTWKQRLAAVQYVFQLIRMVWQTHPRYTVVMGLLRLVRAFVPVASLWVGKLILDTVAAALKSTPDYDLLWRLVALEIAIVVCGEALARASALVESLLSDLFSNHTSIRLMEHAAVLDLYQFENPKFYDQLERARRQTTGRIGLLAQFFSMGQDILTLVSLGAALLVFSPLLLLLLALAVVPSFLGETHFASLEYSLFYRRTPQRRQLDYIRYMGASDETAKEVQIFGLAPWLIEQFRNLSTRFYEENKKLSIRKSFVSSLLSLDWNGRLLHCIRCDSDSNRAGHSVAWFHDVFVRSICAKPGSDPAPASQCRTNFGREFVFEGSFRFF